MRVMLHLGAEGSTWAAGIVRAEWQGAVQVNSRFARAHPMPAVESVPVGVDRDVWLAYVALGELVREQIEQAARDAR